MANLEERLKNMYLSRSYPHTKQSSVKLPFSIKTIMNFFPNFYLQNLKGAHLLALDALEELTKSYFVGL